MLYFTKIWHKTLTLQEMLIYNESVVELIGLKIKYFGGLMKLRIWSKTLLNIYGCLFRLTKEIDKIVLNFGLTSGFYNGFCKTYKDIEKIIELTDRKITLINIKVLIENCLVNLDDTSCKILSLKFVDKVSNETIINALNIKRRTFFRKYIQAINGFANQLLINGYDSNAILHLIGDETWINDVYNAYYEKEMSKKLEPEISKYSIYNLAVNNLKKERKYVLSI